jgi:hypothetical protein
VTILELFLEFLFILSYKVVSDYIFLIILFASIILSTEFDILFLVTLFKLYFLYVLIVDLFNLLYISV